MLCSYMLLLLVLFGYEAVQGANIESSKGIIYFTDRLERLFKKKCLENSNETVLDDVLDGLEHFNNCWQLSLPAKKITGEELYDYCMDKSENFTKHLAQFVEKLTPCLEPEEKYLKRFILDSYGNYNHYFCKSIISETEQNQDECYNKLKDNPEMDPLVACYKNSEILGDYSTIDLITKAKLCNDISETSSCNRKLLEEHCPDDTNFINLRLILFKQALEICAKLQSDQVPRLNDVQKNSSY